MWDRYSYLQTFFFMYIWNRVIYLPSHGISLKPNDLKYYLCFQITVPCHPKKVKGSENEI